MNNLQRLLAIQEIISVKARYFRYVDCKDWAHLRELFTPDAELFYPESSRESLPLGPALTRIEQALRGAVTVHHGHMPEIEFISAGIARVIVAMEDVLIWNDGEGAFEGRRKHGFGHYHEEYRCIGERWLIHRLKLTRLRLEEAAAVRAVG